MPDPNPIRHVVVLMLENRAFDHLMGFFPGVNGLKGTEFNLADPTAPDSQRFVVGQNAPFAIANGQGPTHSINATNQQLAGDKTGPTPANPATNDGFVLAYKNALFADRVANPTSEMIGVVMQSFAPGSLPTLTALAQQYTLCDNWFADVPGPTQPNRLYVHAATSAGYAHNVWTHTFDNTTIYNHLQDAGLDWAIYYSDDNDVAKFSQITAKAYTTASEESDWEAAKAAGAHGAFFIYEEFFAMHAAKGTLPAYTFIEPRFGSVSTSMHAPNDVRPGDQLVHDVYTAISGNPALWANTLLIVTFDEHGGFYDHVAPGAAPNPDGLVSPPQGDASYAPVFAFDRLGLRVPTLLISPFTAGGHVLSTQLQHTSILSTLKNLFGLPTFLTKRDASAPAFDGIFTNAPAPAVLPAAVAVERLVLASLPAEDDPQHPANQRADELLAQKVDGWHQLTRNLPDGKGGSESKPETSREAHEFIRAQVARYSNYRYEQARRVTASAPTGVQRMRDPAPHPYSASDLHLDLSTLATLWDLFRNIGIYWQNVSDSTPMYSQWLVFLGDRIQTDPRYAAEYRDGAGLLRELVAEKGDAAYAFVFTDGDAGTKPANTRIRRLRQMVSNEFVLLQLAIGGFKAFGAKNYLGYFGGPNIHGAPAPYRTPEPKS